MGTGVMSGGCKGKGKREEVRGSSAFMICLSECVKQSARLPITGVVYVVDISIGVL